jgi:hypothetical protein
MLYESKLSTEERNALSDKDFGLPDERKYPLHDVDRIKSAIRFFNYCPDDKKKELADNINKALKRNKLKVNVGTENEFSKYIDSKFLNESVSEFYDIFIETEYQEIVRNYLDAQLYIINTDTDICKPYLSANQYIDITTNSDIKDKIKLLLSNPIAIDRLIYDYDVTTKMTEMDLFKISIVDCVDKPFYVPLNTTDGNIEFVWFIALDDMLMYLTKRVSEENYIAIDMSDALIQYVTCQTDIPVKHVNSIWLETPEQQMRSEVVSEGVSINANGDVKVTIGKTKSYMDEYMEAHRILVENYKNGNYNAMKSNLAFLFSLISIIERDKRYKERDPETVKARAFAINDFKTYLKHVQKHEPSFDFEAYYKKSEHDKTIINIPRNAIIGIKKLLKAILS